ncbi:hypothetical protein ACFOUV_00875 [Oceanobacillus longus]|uniref:Uncharacterized protein n=1 Tax=Oceanobacillus longus TaxID=930120 RepID=A0ABV8GRM8_9BACI
MENKTFFILMISILFGVAGMLDIKYKGLFYRQVQKVFKTN